MATLLDVRNLVLEVQTRLGWRPIVQDLSFSLEQGDILGIVGESGSGKSLTALTLAGLLPKSVRVRSGTVMYQGQTLWEQERRSLNRSLRGTEIGIIPQNPLASLSPTLKVGAQMIDGLRAGKVRMPKREAKLRALALLEEVGIREPRRVYEEYPHRLSGGMLQRVLIAIAMMGNPALLIADEPTTALDLRIQAQVVEIFRQRQARTGLAIILISHDLSLIGAVCDRVLVLYAGQEMELAERRMLLSEPAHPYSQALLKATPSLCTRLEELTAIPGSVPPTETPLPGCSFYPRCARRQDICSGRTAAWRRLEPGQASESSSGSLHPHWVRCHNPLRKLK